VPMAKARGPRDGRGLAVSGTPGSRELTGLALLNGGFEGAAIRLTTTGSIELSLSGPADSSRILLPGFVNAHSHAFQRVLRGRAEERAGDFWSWRDRMYRAAAVLEPDDVRIASRAAFLEMLLAGFTAVVEFHYLHHDPVGRPYADSNVLADAVLEAAAEVGIRICLLPSAYARAGPGREPSGAQRRFADPSPSAFLARFERLRGSLTKRDATCTLGLALHSVRALPRDWLLELAGWLAASELPAHMHVAEQPAEVGTCLAEHGRRPVELLHDVGLLTQRFTAVHAIHVTENEIKCLGSSGAGVCVCPSTEANLGDGFAPAEAFMAAGVPLAFGTDSNVSIDPFAELRELDYRERLRTGSRAGVAPALRLLEAGTHGGAERAGWAAAPRARRRAAGIPDRDSTEAARSVPVESAGSSPVGRIEDGFVADLVVLNAEHPALTGADPASLGEHLLVAGSPGLVQDVYVAGRRVIQDGRHPRQEEILRDFAELQRRLWRD
jgi:formimidoylglutamate deiminase